MFTGPMKSNNLGKLYILIIIKFLKKYRIILLGISKERYLSLINGKFKSYKYSFEIPCKSKIKCLNQDYFIH